MTTPAKLDANRRNALRSTGPTSPEGKARVSRNAVRHGLLARDALLPVGSPLLGFDDSTIIAFFQKVYICEHQ